MREIKVAIPFLGLDGKPAPEIEDVRIIETGKIGYTFELLSLRMVNPPPADSDFLAPLEGGNSFLSLGVKGAEICNGAKHRHLATAIRWALFKFDNTRFAADFNHSVFRIHFR